MAEKIEGLAKSARGKKAEAVREKLFRDAQKLRDGSELERIDKYIPVIYDRLPSVFDYFSGLTVFSEYTNAVERAKGVISQYNEDCRILLEEGSLCRGLEAVSYTHLDVYKRQRHGCAFAGLLKRYFG